MKTKTIRDISLKIWEHVCNMEVTCAEDLKTGTPLIPVLNKELKLMMADIIERCAERVEPIDQRARLELLAYAGEVRAGRARAIMVATPPSPAVAPNTRTTSASAARSPHEDCHRGI